MSQTRWTGIVARILHLFRTMRPEDVEAPRSSYFARSAGDGPQTVGR